MADTEVDPNNQTVRFRGSKGMAKLNAAEREEMPKSEFAEPAEKKYPVPDKAHAANAKGRAKQMLKRGTISQAEYDKICAKADMVEDEK